MKEIDSEELKRMNGKEGNPVCIAVEGKVYDVSQSNLWKTGTHMARHASGQDLTLQIGAAPHDAEVLEKFPQVGIIKAAPSTTRGKEVPAFLQKLLYRYPFLRRDPHHM